MTASGLSAPEMSDYLDVSVKTIRQWQSTRREPRQGVIDEMANLVKKQFNAAIEIISEVEFRVAEAEGELGIVELALANDDYEAQSLDWPCGAAQAQVFGLVIAHQNIGVKWQIVPRGTTLASAAAADAHDRIL